MAKAKKEDTDIVIDNEKQKTVTYDARKLYAESVLYSLTNIGSLLVMARTYNDFNCIINSMWVLYGISHMYMNKDVRDDINASLNKYDKNMNNMLQTSISIDNYELKKLRQLFISLSSAVSHLIMMEKEEEDIEFNEEDFLASGD